MAENFPQINGRPQITDPVSSGNTKQEECQKTKRDKQTNKNFISRNTILKLQKIKYKES